MIIICAVYMVGDLRNACIIVTCLYYINKLISSSWYHYVGIVNQCSLLNSGCDPYLIGVCV